MCNHEGNFDIPAMLVGVGHAVGFIAKKQLQYIRFLGQWMYALHCIFLDRTKAREAADVIRRGAEKVKRGHPMVIFPEGTRSRGGETGLFKKGSLKLAIQSAATIVPVTIQGTSKAFEKYHKLMPARVLVKFHQPIDLPSVSEEDRHHLMEKIRQTIVDGMEAEFR
jgi:1-acyl-sn-glycerol-3-phosphate acyltransferase